MENSEIGLSEKTDRQQLIQELALETLKAGLPYRGSSLLKGKIRKPDVYFTSRDLKDFSDRLDRHGISHSYDPAASSVWIAAEEGGSTGSLYLAEDFHPVGW